MYSYFQQPSIEEVRATQPHARDRFVICDAQGALERAEALRMPQADWCNLIGLRSGVPELTIKCEAYMDRFEHDIFMGRAWEPVDDVVGAVPVVPAVLAGHPQCMRRRQNALKNTGPLTIMFELTGSSGAMNTRVGRGAAMLALVRMLSNVRPVEFWTLTTLGRHGEMNMLACKMDSMPLDVARSAAMLMDVGTLGALAEVNRKTMGGGSWSYGDERMERTWSGEALRRVLEPSSELLFIPAAYLSDQHHNPEQWIRDMLRKYGLNPADKDED